MNKNLCFAKKVKTKIIIVIISAASFFVFSPNLFAQSHITPKTAADAIKTAQNNGQYLFLLFYETKEDSVKVMENTVKDFKSKTSEKISFHRARTTDYNEKDIIAKYGIDRAPLPVLLVFAPNGAMTGGFVQKVTEKELKGSIVSDLVMSISKTVQEKKIALVLLQNNRTKFNKESLIAAQEFSNDSKLKGFVDIIKADPDDSKNNSFISSLKLNEKISEAIVVFIVPPGTIAGVFKGNISKDTLMSALSSCSSGSDNKGCCPRR